MRDHEIAKNLDIPVRTLANWKIADDWRLKLYTFLQIQEKEEIAPVLDRVNKILESRAKTAN